MDSPSLESINRALLRMRKDIMDIKARMVDADSILTEEDYKALIAYEKEKKAGKLVSHKKLKKELGI